MLFAVKVAAVFMDRLPARIHRRQTHQLVQAQPQDALCCRVGRGDVPLGVLIDHTLWNGLEQAAVGFFAGAQRRLDAFAFGDVAQHAGPDDAAVGLALGLGPAVNPLLHAAGRADAKFMLPQHHAGARRAHRRGVLGHVLRHDQPAQKQALGAGLRRRVFEQGFDRGTEVREPSVPAPIAAHFQPVQRRRHGCRQVAPVRLAVRRRGVVQRQRQRFSLRLVQRDIRR